MPSVLVVLVDVTWLTLGRLTLRETTGDTAWTEITSIGQILEAHLAWLRIGNTSLTTPRVNNRAAWLLAFLGKRGLARADPERRILRHSWVAVTVTVV